MAVYSNLTGTVGTHNIFESSNLKSSIVGNIYDVVLESDVDNGTPIKVGDYTGDGLQLRAATVATAGDKIAVVGTPALIKSAMTKAQEDPANFYNVKGTPAKAYEIVAEDIFAIRKDFVTGTVEVGATVVVDDGKYKIATGATTSNGFVGKVHSIAVGDYCDIVRIFVVKNEQK